MVTVHKDRRAKNTESIKNDIYIPFSIPSVILPELLFLPLIVMLLGE